jgi:hypothetical protein
LGSIVGIHRPELDSVALLACDGRHQIEAVGAEDDDGKLPLFAAFRGLELYEQAAIV